MIPKERIKPGTTVKIKTWGEIKKLHGNKLDEYSPSHEALCKFLKSHAGKKRTVVDTKYSADDELKIYVKEKNEYNMYLILEEIASVPTDIELDESLFEL